MGFDFRETVTMFDPTGTGYRAKTRFAKFFNIPELQRCSRGADVQTADMLNLLFRKQNFMLRKSREIQKEMVRPLRTEQQKFIRTWYRRMRTICF